MLKESGLSRLHQVDGVRAAYISGGNGKSEAALSAGIPAWINLQLIEWMGEWEEAFNRHLGVNGMGLMNDFPFDLYGAGAVLAKMQATWSYFKRHPLEDERKVLSTSDSFWVIQEEDYSHVVNKIGFEQELLDLYMSTLSRVSTYAKLGSFTAVGAINLNSGRAKLGTSYVDWGRIRPDFDVGRLRAVIRSNPSIAAGMKTFDALENLIRPDNQDFAMTVLHACEFDFGDFADLTARELLGRLAGVEMSEHAERIPNNPNNYPRLLRWSLGMI